ncbi:Bromodomain containing protein [Tritrichomonas foetus]|uniref:Bromodomain containing protein n=1 Tax=Tritrichomonas foetus TaxID=1144522 RepID=A0A1J4K6Y5_9EUKA|nr:Bromodomain containing protein [Tritrichomonas foetus]|eukprot:OHT06738.1 Bromodomain containing protein [Tritrichomonas foetus]
MQSLSEFQKNRCIKVLNKLTKYHISTMFAVPVDPERDNCPDYFQVIHRPMDLKTVREKLEGDQYTTVEEWKDDVNQIWENCYHYNGKQSYVSILAKQLQINFKEMTETLSSNSVVDWAIEVENMKNEIVRILKNGPKPQPVQTQAKKGASHKSSSEFTPSHSRTSRHQTSQHSPDSFDQSEQEYQPDQLDYIPETPSRSRGSASKSNSSNRQNSATKRSQNQPQRSISPQKHSAHQVAETVSQTQSVNDEENTKQEQPEEQQTEVVPFTNEELQTLVDEINGIETTSDIRHIVDLIKKLEPGIEPMENDFGEVEIEVSRLRHSTLVELRSFINSLKNV